MKARGVCSNVFQVLKDCDSKPSKTICCIWRERKIFHDKTILKPIISNKIILKKKKHEMIFQAKVRNEHSRKTVERNTRPNLLIRQNTTEYTKKTKVNNIMISINMHISVISWNINGLSSPIKRHRLNEWVKKKVYL